MGILVQSIPFSELQCQVKKSLSASMRSVLLCCAFTGWFVCAILMMKLIFFLCASSSLDPVAKPSVGGYEWVVQSGSDSIVGGYEWVVQSGSDSIFPSSMFPGEAVACLHDYQPDHQGESLECHHDGTRVLIPAHLFPDMIGEGTADVPLFSPLDLFSHDPSFFVSFRLPSCNPPPRENDQSLISGTVISG
jgi:hypothetical protein